MARAADPAAIARGAYLFNATDCVSCHTDKKNDGAPLAGGRPLATPFGTYYSPNITPDDATGIGKWTLDDFHRALRDGRDDDGDFLFPVFPFTSFTGMSDADIADLYAYLMAQPPVARPDTPHQVKFPFGWRPLLFGWRLLFFRAGPLAPVDGQSAEWNRGRYLVEAVAQSDRVLVMSARPGRIIEEIVIDLPYRDDCMRRRELPEIGRYVPRLMALLHVREATL